MPNPALLLDSNLLLLLLIGSLDRDLVRNFKRTSSFSDSDFDLLQDIVVRSGGIITTPHVLTEVSNLANSLRDDLKPSFSQIFKVSIAHFEERFTAATELSQDPLFRFGMTDTSLHHAANDAIVLTEDGRFAAQLAKRGVAVMSLKAAAQQLHVTSPLSASKKSTS